MTIPMITFMNFTVLTDSLANSMLLLSLAGLVYVYWYDHVSVKIYIMIIISLIIGCLLRADRLYSCLLLVVIAFLVRIIRKSAERKQIISAMLVVCLLTVGVTKGVDSLTQTPGINGRIQTNFEFVLLDRIVWPNMSNNYEYFSDEIKSVISLEEAQTFDQHNNNVMYQMAPLVEARVGKEEAKNIYREMAKVVFLHQPGKVVFDIAEDIFTMLITPISSYMHLRGKWSKNDGWNVYCMSSVDSEGTTIFLSYYHYTFMLLLAVGVLRYAIMRKKMCVKEQFHKFVSVLLPFFGMGIILTLWFSIGDGAPPNDRYALLIYIIWSLVTIGLLGAGKRLPGTKE